MKRALVLGGGGLVGVGWESGFVAGLRDGGIDVREADVIVGTSAGSFVGAQVAAGHELTREAPPATGSDTGVEGLLDNIDMQSMTQVFQLWSSVDVTSPDHAKQMGNIARQAKTVDESLWVATTGPNTGVDDWPAGQLRITSVDVENGDLVVLTQDSGASLHRAVAASCSIPGMFPPVTIGERRLMDGGVRSITNADIVADDRPESILVIAPIGEHTPVFGPLCKKSLDQEVEALKQQGSKVTAVMPSAEDVARFGANIMDATKVDEARQAGYGTAIHMARRGDIAW